MLYHRQQLTNTHALNRIQKASKVPAEAVSMNYDLVRKGTFNLEDIQAIIASKVRC